jgi:UDP-N-acetylglucosamine diphosphorylase / glucose-1-phosphate thymidylyltransferase / UDP-N-acetylgalactosamine diphosphorylase / glucosamine-1-phosphate N-acetyltransferase / galactosamine-1-phosphate N-acetyltransferase
MKTAVILAAGKGAKIWPYNEYWPKAALPVGGVPNIIRLIKNLHECNIERIIVVVDHLERRIRYLLSGAEGVEIFSAPAPSGTAASLEKVLDQVEDDLLVVYGDVVLSHEIMSEFIDQFRQGHNDALLLAKIIDKERSQDWICAKADSSGRVLNIYGHPRAHYVDHRLIGIYAFRKQPLSQALSANPGFMLNVNVGGMPPLQAELEQSIQMMVEKEQRVYLHPLSHGVIDMDKPWHILQANKLAIQWEMSNLERKISSSAVIHPTAEISGNVVLGENVTIGRNVWIKGNSIIGDNTIIDNGATIDENVIIGQGCRIADFCKIGSYSVIGNKNRIGHCAEFQGVTFDNVSFTHYGEVYGIVGTSTDIAAGVTVGILRFDDFSQNQKVNGRMEIPEEFGNAVFFGDYTRTGISSQYMPGVKIGCNCAIGSNVIVQNDLPSGKLIYSEQALVFKDWGPEKYGW